MQKLRVLADRLSTGIDSVNFVMPKSALLKYLDKYKMRGKLRGTNRNAQVNDFVLQKFHKINACHEKHKFKVRYLPIISRVKSLSNTMIVIENSKDLHKIARERKKSLDYFCMVVFAGLYQPSKDVEFETMSWLKKFSKRFKAYQIDIAVDFFGIKGVNNINQKYFSNATKRYHLGDGNIRNATSSLYVNAISDAYSVKRILWYDKYKKQTNFHKEDILPELEKWQRVEIRLELNKNFWKWFEEDGLDEPIDMLRHITQNMGVSGIAGVNLDVLSEQICILKDLRCKRGLKAWAKLPKPKSKSIGGKCA